MQQKKKQQKRRALGVVAGMVALALVSTALLGPVAAQAGYYNNSSGVVQSDVPENTTLENILDLAVELSPSLFGVGEQDPSGSGFQGVLLVGLVFAGVSGGLIGAAGVGPIGGTILGSLVSYGLVDLGFAPQWVKPLLLFGIGTLAFVMFRRLFR